MTPEDKMRPRLGRGLAALIGDAGDENSAIERARGQRRVPIGFLRANPKNPRQRFGDEDLEELAASIREKGIIQPIVVRPVAGSFDAYEIIAGERRWRAAQRAGLHDVPVTIVEASDREALELAIIENVQRADLNAIEEAVGYERLIQEFSYSQNDLAKVIGKSRSHVANTLRLVRLPDAVKASVINGELTAGHARALLSVANPEEVAQAIIRQGLTVRDAESIAQEHAEDSGRVVRARSRVEKDPDTIALERTISDVLGLKVLLDHRGDGGELKIRYNSLEQLDDLCRRLRG
ncbi:ParB/RepB/Spo0J family partition protein [Labrys monachus]|uniref:ParB family chromosome partitioning protein n=1 Tax=Labrys monachus TaxID=217067 RepID=A0ABU0FN68_9HYPH|nr:ParB/RepB/Spo0J family partition protein [Labrys monachus]MDQ0396064.1 ParB family chromosome partitioning protein [Labrys monachus]